MQGLFLYPGATWGCHLARRPTRLYRKGSGIYFVRVLLPASDATPTKREIRRSLRTFDAALARSISSTLNALLEGVATNQRKCVVDHFFATSGWMISGDRIHASDEDDHRRLVEFLRNFPSIERAFALRLGRGAASTALPPPKAVGAEAKGDGAHGLDAPNATASVTDPPVAESRGTSQHVPTLTLPALIPGGMRLSELIDRYEKRHRGDQTIAPRTVTDRVRLYNQLRAHLSDRHSLSDPLVHEVSSAHLSTFIDEQASRVGKRVNREGNRQRAAAKTSVKKLSDLSTLFEYARTELEATPANPVTGLEKRRRSLRALAKREDVHYAPFTDHHLKQIFDPAQYLAANRTADYYWGPLLGLHLGVRLGEIVHADLAQIDRDPDTGIWYMDIHPDDAKNANSIRRLPLTQPLIDLGLLRYVEHVRALGSTALFPHIDRTTRLAAEKRSKNQSRHFGSYLNRLDIRDPKLVFHSFRHTVVTALQDGNTPLHDAMMIAGHEAISRAIRTGRITPSGARSVHLSVYTHSDLQRMGVDYPLVRFKAHLERCINPPIDYDRLSRAASVVLSHTRKVGNRFVSGWPAQRASYTQSQIQKLDDPGVSYRIGHSVA